MVSILCTGGAGYLGSVLVPALLGAGHRVHVLDNFMHGQGEALAACCVHPNFDVTRGDCRDPRTIESLLKWADVVIPLAAIVGAPACAVDHRAATSTNVGAIITACDALSRDQRVIFSNTNSGYGSGGDAPIDEDAPMNPVSLYGRTKWLAEEFILGRKNSVALRFATLFGASPRMRLDLLVNDFVYRAVNDRAVTLFEAHFRRNYLHVQDAARAILFAIDNFDAMKGRAYNCGLEDANLTKAQLCAKIQDHVPGFVWNEAPIGEDPDKRDYVVSNARLLAAGFRPSHSLNDGIAELIKLYRMLRVTQHRNA